MVIRYIDAKFPGATHDAAVWNGSALKLKLQRDYENGERNTWLVGMFENKI